MTASDVLLRLRNAHRDRERAQAYEKMRSQATLAEALRDPEAFTTHLHRLPKTGFPVGDMETPAGAAPLWLSRDAALTRWLIMGASGTGKTTVVKSFHRWSLSNDVPVDFVDCKGDLFRPTLREIALCGWRLPVDRRMELVNGLLVSDPASDAVIPLNRCRLRPGVTAETVAYDVTLSFARYFASTSPLGPHMQNILRYGVLLLIESDLTLLELPLILSDELLRTILVERSRNPLVREFFFTIFPQLPTASAPALAARLQGVFMHESLRLSFGADDGIDFRDIILRGHRMVVSLGKGRAPEAIIDLYASMFVQAFCEGVFCAEGKGPERLAIFDEFFHLLESPAVADRFCTLLCSARSFGVHAGFVCHEIGQADKKVRDALLTNIGVALLFRGSQASLTHFGDFLPSTDAALIERALRRGEPPPSRAATRALLMERMQRQENRVAYFWDRRQPYNAVRVRIAEFQEPHELLGIRPETLDEFIETSGIARGGYAVSRDTVRRQIAERQERLRALVTPVRSRERSATRKKSGGAPNLG